MKNPAINSLRALIVGAVMLTAVSSPMAYADSRGNDGGPTSISHINNGNTYNYQGVGTITLDNILGESLLLPPIRTVASRLTF